MKTIHELHKEQASYAEDTQSYFDTLIELFTVFREWITEDIPQSDERDELCEDLLTLIENFRRLRERDWGAIGRMTLEEFRQGLRDTDVEGNGVVDLEMSRIFNLVKGTF